MSSRENDETVDLLWTGGWDSTFRLLELVLCHRRRVRPIYLVNTDRASTLLEFRTMKRIRRLISDVCEKSAALVEPSDVVLRYELAPDAEIAGQYSRLTRRSHVGPQYAWLARMAKQRNLSALELGVQADGRIDAILDGQVRPVRSAKGRVSWELQEGALTTDLAMFRSFRFPLLRVTKLEMERIAREQGFADIMEHTWFCHSPLLGKPCGLCLPCQYAREEGMARRIPRLRNSPLYRRAMRAVKDVRSRIVRLGEGRSEVAVASPPAIRKFRQPHVGSEAAP